MQVGLATGFVQIGQKVFFFSNLEYDFMLVYFFLLLRQTE